MGMEQCQKKIINKGVFSRPVNTHSLFLIDECTDLTKQEAAVKTLIVKNPIS